MQPNYADNPDKYGYEQKSSGEQPKLADYEITGVERVLTPALAIYPKFLEANIELTLRLLRNDPNRWRPHVKAIKTGYAVRKFVERGVVNFKCATTKELIVAAEAGAKDVIVAYQLMNAAAKRVRELSEQFAEVRISTIVESASQVQQWAGSKVGLFIDINTGMDRTGIQHHRISDIVDLAKAIKQAGIEFRGLHCYDSQAGELADVAEREKAANLGYSQLIDIVKALEQAGIAVEEVATSNTYTFLFAANFKPFQNANFTHRVSPSRIIYGDVSIFKLQERFGYQPAAVVVSTVVSQPMPDRVTCDAGHKAIAMDAGLPNCVMIGHLDMRPLKPKEEHMTIFMPEGSNKLSVGDQLYLMPRHVCTTVSNFDQAILVENGTIVGLQAVDARSREAPVKP